MTSPSYGRVPAEYKIWSPIVTQHEKQFNKTNDAYPPELYRKYYPYPSYYNELNISKWHPLALKVPSTGEYINASARRAFIS